MHWHDHKMTIEMLQDFTNRDLQHRLWTLDGSSGEVSSLIEFTCMLFDDTGLARALEKGRTGYSVAAEDSLRQLNQAIRQVPKCDPAVQVDHPTMERVRERALTALSEITKSLSGG